MLVACRCSGTFDTDSALICEQKCNCPADRFGGGGLLDIQCLPRLVE
jgi:hypothetical protein